MADGPAPHATVLIATRDRPGQLAACIESVLLSDYPSFDVIVVDQSSEDNRATLPGDDRLHVIATESAGKSRALNLGLGKTTGDVVLFTDDDCTVPPTWISGAVAELRSDDAIGVVFGPLLAAPHDMSREFIPAFVPQSRERVSSAREYRRLDGRAGANMTATRQALQVIGPFDECIGPGSKFSGLEEFDLSYRALRAGFVVVIETANPVLHWGVRPRDSGVAGRLMSSYSYGEGAVLAKHGRCGDRALFGDAVVKIARRFAHALISWVRTGTADGLDQARHLTRGFVDGLRQPLDREARLFVERRAPARRPPVRTTS